jgi:hypothetical protein
LTRNAFPLTIPGDTEIIIRHLMNSTIAKNLRPPVLLLALVLAAAGCATTPKPVAWNIKITKPTGIEVDLVGITQREKDRLAAYALDKYWSPGDLERKNADKLTSSPQTPSWSVPVGDPKWKKWLGRSVTDVCVIANLPGTFEGAADARREFLPLDKNHWLAQGQTLEIEIKENRILVLTPEKPQR